ncbi:hypothetical protein ACA910_000838 [Epithemia clementina (nom. ined.)]
MKTETLRTINYMSLLLAFLPLQSSAFSGLHQGSFLAHTRVLGQPKTIFKPVSVLLATSEDTDEEIERLRSMAAKLRAEAAALESEQQKAVAAAAERAFQKFDIDNDGEISLEELKRGLEKEFKMELSEKRAKQLMDAFDKSGDGVLQMDEFVGVDILRNRLDALARDEKALALEKAKAAQMESEAVKLLQAQLEMLNDRKPSNTDKIISILPYLFPLLDGLQFAKYLVLENPENPLSITIAVFYAFYRSIPFAGIITFFALSFLSGNITLNRLIRYNMQQAIFLDIALFFPGLIAALLTLVTPGTIPPALSELGDDFLFVVLLATVGYSVVSSLLGIEPNKIPIISQAVLDRMPTVDMFDAEGRFIPRNQQKTDKKKDDDKDENKDKK